MKLVLLSTNNLPMSYVKQFVRGNNIQPGDAIIARKTGLLTHYAIYLGWEDLGWGNGGHVFAINMMHKGVVIVPEDELFKMMKTYQPTRIRRLNLGVRNRDFAVKRALSLVGTPYNLLTYNCEHFANDVQGYPVHSQQVQLGALGFLVFGLTLAFSAGRK
ncbi:MAG: hypothetical protein SFY70_00575 [Bacteroidia bacterium]|nr:hypothetical protein [Bacteroidia bacterium]